MHPHRRKKKKRANWSRNIRNIQLEASEGKFGFTISGQQPCVLSSIVRNSPADIAGLKSGDFLISVNGQSVWQKDHEEIVNLIALSSSNQIRITIADNYFSDSSDEDVHHQRFRPKYPHSKTRLNRLQLQARSSGDLKYLESPPIPEQHPRFSHRFTSPNYLEPPPLPFEAHNVIHSPNARNNSDIFNVSAMVSPTQMNAASSLMNSPDSVSFRVMVGYLGTIEMPKQIATSSKLQTVRSCIRKLRQEKRNPALVLMNILPSSLNLLNSNSVVLATYPSSRLNYVSSSSDNNSKFFGLVTSTVYANDANDSFDSLAMRKFAISNSCHVFVIDTKLIDHNAHIVKAEKFNITCSKDPISNSCLEFPTNSEYICNLIRSMYSIKSPVKTEAISPGRPSAVRNLNFDEQRGRAEHRFDDPHEMLMANSPHPSNHSEITTTSSNSDSGIGFHNDYANISDRILVVDFPGLNANRRIGVRNQNQLQYLQRQRPRPIVNDLQLQAVNPIRNIRSMNFSSPQPSSSSDLPIHHSKSKSADYSPVVDVEKMNPRLTIRAMPDPVMKKSAKSLLGSEESSPDYENVYPQKVEDVWYNGKSLDEAGNVIHERGIDVPEDSFTEQQRAVMVRSCDDIIMVMNKEEARYRRQDDRREEASPKCNDEHVFLAPVSKPPRKAYNKKSSTISGKIKSHEDSKPKNESNLLHYKLSPKVFGVPRPVSMSFENLSTSSTKRKSLFGSRKKNKEPEDVMFSIWGSLQELRHSDVLKQPQHGNFLEGTYSEPSLNQNLDEVSDLFFLPPDYVRCSKTTCQGILANY